MQEQKKSKKKGSVTVIRAKEPDKKQREQVLEEIGRYLFEPEEHEENTM